MKPLIKVRREIRRKEEILAAVQADLEVLRSEEQQLENSEMIAAIRNAKLSADDMLALVHALKKGSTELSTLLPLFETQALNKATESEDESHD